jgi:Family of unknown function (DUF6222)
MTGAGDDTRPVEPVATFPRLGPGIVWSDLVREMERDRADAERDAPPHEDAA